MESGSNLHGHGEGDYRAEDGGWANSDVWYRNISAVDFICQGVGRGGKMH
jgi:hypothetical protein